MMIKADKGSKEIMYVNNSGVYKIVYLIWRPVVPVSNGHPPTGSTHNNLIWCEVPQNQALTTLLKRALHALFAEGANQGLQDKCHMFLCSILDLLLDLNRAANCPIFPGTIPICRSCTGRPGKTLYSPSVHEATHDHADSIFDRSLVGMTHGNVQV